MFPTHSGKAAQLGKLVPVVGTGVSKLAGSPDWDEFALLLEGARPPDDDDLMDDDGCAGER